MSPTTPTCRLSKEPFSTQALLDLYSIWEEKGSFDNLHAVSYTHLSVAISGASAEGVPQRTKQSSGLFRRARTV